MIFHIDLIAEMVRHSAALRSDGLFRAVPGFAVAEFKAASICVATSLTICRTRLTLTPMSLPTVLGSRLASALIFPSSAIVLIVRRSERGKLTASAAIDFGIELLETVNSGAQAIH